MSEQIRWRIANRSDCGKLAQFFDTPGDDPVYGILCDTDGESECQGIKCCDRYWCETADDDDGPIWFRCCEVQETDQLTAAQQRVKELDDLRKHLVDTRGQAMADRDRFIIENAKLKHRISLVNVQLSNIEWNLQRQDNPDKEAWLRMVRSMKENLTALEPTHDA